MPGLKMKFANFVGATAKNIRSKSLNAEALNARRTKLAAVRATGSASASHTRRAKRRGARRTLSTPQRILREKQRAKVEAAKRAAALAAKAKGSRSGSGTRKSPRPRAGNVRLTFRNGSGKMVTKAVKNLTDEEEFLLTSDQMDKLTAYHLETIHGFRK